MNKALIQRGQSSDQGTFGTWHLPGWTAFSIELPDRDNLKQRSCIPAGKYLCEIVYSNHCAKVLGRDWAMVYTLRDVPGRGNILLHPGCLAGNVDLGWIANFEGCIGAGSSAGLMRNKKGVMQRAVFGTRPTVRKIMKTFGNKPFELEIKSC